MKIFYFRMLFLLAFFATSPDLFADTKCREAFSSLEESHRVFAQNFKDGKLKEDNAYFVVDYALKHRDFISESPSKDTPFIARVIDPTFGPNKMLVEKIDLASGLREEITLHYKMGLNLSYYEKERLERNQPDHEVLSFIAESGGGAGYRTIIDIMRADKSIDRKIDFKDIKDIFNDIKAEKYSILLYQGHPQLSAVFNAQKSNKKRLTMDELELPELEHIEEKLDSQGYHPFFTKGLNEVNQWIALKEQFIKHKVNPHITHIDYFARKIPQHIAHIREGIKPDMEGTVERIRMLNYLEQHATEAIQNKQVTYRWWIKFNLALSLVLSSSYKDIPSLEKNGSLDDKLSSGEPLFSDMSKKTINLFPLKIALPTIKGELGFMVFNKISLFDIYPIGLVNKDMTVDNFPMEPLVFFRHDLGHARNHNIHYRAEELSLFQNELMKKIESLPRKEREHVELLYFDITHETLDTFISFINNPKLKHQLRIIQKAVFHLGNGRSPARNDEKPSGNNFSTEQLIQWELDTIKALQLIGILEDVVVREK